MLKTVHLCLLSALVTSLFFNNIAIAKDTVSDEQVKQSIINESIAAYPGTCACPFNTARNGSSCGGRSAWSKAGGYSPICYKKEVTKEMIKQWRDSHSINN
ncbi:hypothetical protein [Serratia sp. DD3]|uniref:hypothetical protein n=1 Tax=Serratia sp. DD3 TaxID=1410619 RepID=UPI0003C4FA8D|nr:hypothetical protein [Serratia sp. DD3]KEY57186.1 hypothetical protein SRDD_38570 [Serratia sp. DD3]